MATRVAFAAISRARPPPLRVASALKAPGHCFNPPPHPYRGIVAAHISSSACSRTSTRTTSGENSTAPAGSPASAAADSPASTAQSSGSAPVGTETADAGVEGGSEAAASPNTSSDPSSNGNGSTGGGGGGGGDGGSRGPLTWGAVGLLGIVATLAVGYYRMKWEEKQNRTASEVSHVCCLDGRDRS